MAGRMKMYVKSSNWKSKAVIISVFLPSFFLAVCPLFMEDFAGGSSKFKCQPSPADSLGPFYKPNVPERSSVGKGYLLSGTVKSAKDCAPLARARIEFWLAGPDGRYDDEHRAMLFTDSSGKYRLESNFPPPYGFRPPHIHLRVSAEGHQVMVTQHYPGKERKEAQMDLVLAPRE